ncbi:hypothetical protein [Microbulbifer celer]|uniref:DUF1772 domain-containing protein n=1 Tax=Microbulbifer celer TaxID=435905 RepID=A0ABW3U8D5_9GAMM|nr:hypothetical protein [Microbulbifer celer]UFN57618.1 hypothetical protein LPW13_00810 [Microbulbifer celer]
MMAALGFLSASIAASAIYTFWAVSGDLALYARVFPVVFVAALLQSFLFAGPAYLWLKAKGNLRLMPIMGAAVLCAVLPWAVLHLMSGLDHQYLRSGSRILIEDGHLTIHWWRRFFINLAKLAFCGAVAAVVFKVVIDNKKLNL